MLFWFLCHIIGHTKFLLNLLQWPTFRQNSKNLLLLTPLCRQLKLLLNVTNSSSENNFANVSTECSSHHQGESEGGANKTLLFIATHYWRYTSSKVKGRWELLLPSCLLITVIYLQEAHAHGPVSSLRVPSSDPREERSGEMPPRQSQRDHQHTGQPSEVSWPPR